jgi:hypothetical protein
MKTSTLFLLSLAALASAACASPTDEPPLGSSSEAVAVDPGDTDPGHSGPVGTPTGVSIVATAFDRVSVKFTCGSNADAHSLLETASDTGVQKRVADVGCSAGRVMTLSDTKVEPGRTYCWSVLATNLTHEARSVSRCATVPLDLGPVAAPGLSVTTLSQVGLRFVIEDKSTNEGGFRIYGRKVGTPTWQVVHTERRATRRDTSTGTLFRIDDHRFATNETWEFYAEAFKEYAPAVAQSAIVRAQLLPFPVTAPTNVRIVGTEEHAMTVAWDAVPNAESYRIQTSVSAALDPDDVYVDASQTQVRIAPLPSGYDVCMTVTAMNRSNEASSARVCGTTAVPASTNQTSDMTLAPFPPAMGLLPFYGVFPPFGVATGTVSRIELPDTANGTALLALTFIRPTADVADCTDMDKSVLVRRGESLDATGLAKLYGTSTPTLPLALKACASTTTQTVPSPLVRIHWFGR